MKATLTALLLCSGLLLGYGLVPAPAASASGPPSAGPSPASEGWIADFDRAAALAQKQGKSLLVDFTGSDWCIWCKRLDGEVFATEEFVAAASEDFVLVSLDFPSGAEARAAVPNPKRNEELKRKYEVQGFPTVLLMTPTGEVFAQTGYQPGGPEKYLAHLAELLPGRKVVPFLARYEAATPEQRQELALEAVELMQSLSYGSAMAARLVEPVGLAIARDPENDAGLKARALHALLSTGSGDADTATAAHDLDPRNALGLREWALRWVVENTDSADIDATLARIDAFDALGQVHDDEAVFALWLAGAAWNHYREKLQKARYYARKARAIGTDDERFMRALDAILGPG